MVQQNTLARAYDVMIDLAGQASAAGLNYSAMISPEHGGELYFCVRHIGAEIGRCFLRGMETEDTDNYIKQAEDFRRYWAQLILAAQGRKAQEIAELKARLAELEGRA